MQNDHSFLEIIDDYVESDRVTLPPFDKTALRIQMEIQKKDAQLPKIEKLIIADPAVSSQILKLANSSFFRGLSKVMTVRDAVLKRATSHELRTVSLKDAGLVTLLENGIYKAAKGITTIEEVLRCLTRLNLPRPISEIKRLLGG